MVHCLCCSEYLLGYLGLLPHAAFQQACLPALGGSRGAWSFFFYMNLSSQLALDRFLLKSQLP